MTTKPLDDNDLLKIGRLPKDYEDDSIPFGTPRTTRMHSAILAGQKLAFAGAPENPIVTGFVEVDQGLRQLGRKELTMLAADSGVGKSTLSTQIALHNGAEGHGVVYLNLEMSQEMYGLRTLANFISMPTQRARAGDLHEGDHRRLIQGVQDLQLAASRIVLGNAVEHRTMPAIRSLIEKAIKEFTAEGMTLDLIIVDHILQILVNVKNDKDAEGKLRADFVKEIAETYNAHVLSLVHVTRDASKSGRMPTKNELASGAWMDRHPDNILIFHQKRAANGTFVKGANATLSCQKSRWGEPFAVELEYRSGFFHPYTFRSSKIEQAK